MHRPLVAPVDGPASNNDAPRLWEFPTRPLRRSAWAGARALKSGLAVAFSSLRALGEPLELLVVERFGLTGQRTEGVTGAPAVGLLVLAVVDDLAAIGKRAVTQRRAAAGEQSRFSVLR